MIKPIINPSTSKIGCNNSNSKINQCSKPYSVQSILDKSEDNSILDLSIKEKRLRTNFDDSVILDNFHGNESKTEINSADRMKQILFNVIHQRELQCHSNRKINCQNIDYLQSTRSNLDNLQKFCNPSTNLPWNFIRPIMSNISDSNNTMLNQFHKFLFNKQLPNSPLNPHQSLYSRRKNPFSISPNTNNTTNNNTNNNTNTNTNNNNNNNSNTIPNYLNNFSHLFHARLNANQSTDNNTSHLPILSDNFTKQYPNGTIDINAHFNLQNILKSTSNRKRKRTKVTDTRLPRRNSNQVITNYSQIHEPSITDTNRFSTFLNPPSNSSQSSHSDETPGDPKRYTLTPIHLRKAKLMFLYTRYPNSQMLKSYFPDITFYKQNTAQLVKWFSNFREFYYSEMEKAVQRAISNGIQHAKDIDVTVDSELFKNLMTHFNKKKQIVVPCEFLTTVQITLREFFDAISANKNLHQSWKKPIYKTIAKLDQMLPEFFKDMNWMMELAKDENDNMNC